MSRFSYEPRLTWAQYTRDEDKRKESRAIEKLIANAEIQIGANAPPVRVGIHPDILRQLLWD